MSGEGGDGHGVPSGVLAGGGADVGVGVDPQDREVVAVALRQRREGGDADCALPAEGGDARRGVVRDHLQGAGELVDDDGLGLDAADQAEPLVAHRDGRGGGRPVVGWQDPAWRTAEPTA